MTDKYNYYYGSAGISLTAGQQFELRMLLNSLNSSDPTQIGLAVPLYDKLLSFLPTPASANTGYYQVYKWIEGARDVSVGLQISVPIFSGGGVSAATRQASERYEQAYQKKDEQTAKILNELRRQFNLVSSSQAKIKAYQLAEDSALSLVDATRKSVKGGERVNLDVLNAEQQLYSVRRDLSEARYTWLAAWLQLRYYTGELDDSTLRQLAGYFHPA